MKLEYGITSTVAHDPIGKKIKKRKVTPKTGSTEKMSKAIKLVRGTVGSKSQAGKGMVKSIRRKQAKRANWQHEG